MKKYYFIRCDNCGEIHRYLYPEGDPIETISICQDHGWIYDLDRGKTFCSKECRDSWCVGLSQAQLAKLWLTQNNCGSGRCPKNGQICDCCESDIRSIIKEIDASIEESKSFIEKAAIQVANDLDPDGSFLAIIAAHYGKSIFAEKVKKELSRLLE